MITPPGEVSLIDMETESSEDSPRTDVMVIAAAGELLLEVYDETRNESFVYRTGIEQLRQSSPYFASLLDPHKFGEGTRVAERLKQLKEQYGNVLEAPVEELPRVKVLDVGRISRVNSIKNLFMDFLNVLHGLELSTSAPPVGNLANLAVVADRFDALPTLTKFVRCKRFLQTIDAKSKGKTTIVPEERARQKLLIGLLFDHPPWVSIYSKRLIIGGSVRWKVDAEDDIEAAIWWDLPRRIEGML